MEFYPSIRFQRENGCIQENYFTGAIFSTKLSFCPSELRAVHHDPAAAGFAVTNEFAFFLDRNCAADRTDHVAVAFARNFRRHGL
jgi:hypothetical protein